MTSRQIEMTWRCTSCGEKNLGRFKSCQGCRNPKDGSEPYEMPEDTSKAATVTEAGLLRMALAGPDWRCAYCGSDQRRSDNGCLHCGADAATAETEAADPPARPRSPAPPPPAPAPARARRRGLGTWLVGIAVGSLLSCWAFSAVHRWYENRPRDYDATVGEVQWARVVDVERYHRQAHDGFKEAMPSAAEDVKSLGPREHHREDVFDHNETERYSVQVPDGYRTESYSERVSCGETCTTSTRTCHEVCKSNKNGFATCHQECSGGDRRCTTKYCSQQRTRQVPKTRTEFRTREVPKYRSEPRFAEAFSWYQWEWATVRTVRAKGTDVTVHWPASNLKVGLAPGEDEREVRHEQYRVRLNYGDGQSLTLRPTEEAEFVRYAPNSHHPLHTENGRLTVDGQPVTPAAPEENDH